ncbi:MAG: hypothetical protein JWP09_312 [Candidatus Taylorbacteria bacterium]|nr:hypothetical protein [Candidatus Taylorbacteria bacterium]
MIYKFKKTERGFAVITTVIFFLIISVAVISAVVIPTSNQVKTVLEAQKTRQSYLAADNVNDEGLYRLKLGKTLPSTLTLPFSNGVSSSATVSMSGSQEQILTTGTSGDTSRYAQSYFTPVGSATAFAYGAQIGDGGMDISGGARVTGSVYSNGSITSDTSSPNISGSVTVANSAPATVNQTNSYTNGTTPVSFNIGTTTASQDIAQAFQVTSASQLTSIRLYVKKTIAGAPADATIRIVPDSGGKPSNTGVVGTGTLPASAVTTSFTYINIPITQVPSLTVGTTYWIVVDMPSVSTTKYFTIAGTYGTYANGSARYGSWSSSGGSNTWVSIIPANSDIYFDVYLGGIPNTISGSGQYNRLIVGGAAWANQINSTTVTGLAYCQSGTYIYDSGGSTKNCDTSRTDPTPLAFPITDQNITDWKAIATAGGTVSGNYTVSGGQTVSMGPKKINGNLTVTAGSTLSLTGTIWVTGYIDLNGGSYIKLASAGGTSDGMIIADGRVTSTGGSYFQGSGTSGSYMVVMSTSQCPTTGTCSGTGSGNAIEISGGSGAVVTFAPYGTLFVDGGATVNSAIAKRFILKGGSNVNYDTALTSIDFITTGISSGGSSGGWKVSSWNEVTQ